MTVNDCWTTVNPCLSLQSHTDTVQFFLSLFFSCLLTCMARHWQNCYDTKPCCHLDTAFAWPVFWAVYQSILCLQYMADRELLKVWDILGFVNVSGTWDPTHAPSHKAVSTFFQSTVFCVAILLTKPFSSSWSHFALKQKDLLPPSPPHPPPGFFVSRFSS